MLQRLARTSYRRRRRSGYRRLVPASCRLLAISLNGAAGGEFLDDFRCPARRARRPTCSRRRASRRAGSAARSSSGRRGVDDPRCAGLEQLFADIEAQVPDTGREPVRPGSAADLRGRHDRLRRDQPGRRPTRATTPPRSKTIRESGRPRTPRRWSSGRLFASRSSRASSSASCRDHHPAHRLRLGARDGPADHHRPVRHRRRHRARRSSSPTARHARLHAPARR